MIIIIKLCYFSYYLFIILKIIEEIKEIVVKYNYNY